ncbi:DUF4259 domain-containing protein [Leeia sp.]|uniref:DUF4259 domain-containing protein n=1 Tax=Leeia sp. TaxID=2884678 RepID=UPI0035ADBDF0
MGAWSHEPFGNDDALDWVYELEESEGFSVIEQAFEAALAAEDYLDVTDGCNAVAAAELLAKLLGKGTVEYYPEHAEAWLQRMDTPPSAALLAKARQALARVQGEDSELKELWDEAEDEEWLPSVKAIEAALA